MRPTWPGGTIPYRLESDSELVHAGLRGALAAFDGRQIGSSALRFVEKPHPDTRTLVITLEKGCHPVSMTDDEIEIAMGDCPNMLAMSHAVGVTLGLPSMHRRADRDRYLVLGKPGEFSCEDGEFFAKCTDRDGVPAALGPFHFGSPLYARPQSHDECLTDPYADRLYSPRGEFAMAQDACSWVAGAFLSSDVTPNALAELYAIDAGWSPFTVVGTERPELGPLHSCLGDGASFRRAPALVATGGGSLAAFALGGDPIDLWLNESDGQTWGEWVKLAPQPPIEYFAQGFAATLREPERRFVDVVVTERDEVFLASYDRESRQLSAWTNLGAPPSDLHTGFTIAPDGSHGLFVYYYGRTFTPASHAVFARRFDGTAWDEWSPLPALGLLLEEGVPSLAAVLLGGEQHLVAATDSHLLYAIRNTSGAWSDWQKLTLPSVDGLPNPHTIALVSNARYRLALLGLSGGGSLWFSGCDQTSCVDGASWSKPFLIGVTGSFSAAASTPARIDVSALMWEVRPITTAVPCTDGMWHKRWQAPD